MRSTGGLWLVTECNVSSCPGAGLHDSVSLGPGHTPRMLVSIGILYFVKSPSILEKPLEALDGPTSSINNERDAFLMKSPGA